MKWQLLEGKHIRLRLMCEDDFPYLIEANHDPDIEQLAGWIYPMYAEELKEFYENEQKDGAMCFMIENKKTWEIIGEVGLHEIRQWDKTAEVSITIFKKLNQNKWYGSDALDALLRYAFYGLSLRKLIAWIYAPNERSIGLFKKFWFSLSGSLKAHRLYRGRYEDTLIYEKFRSETYANFLGDE